MLFAERHWTSIQDHVWRGAGSFRGESSVRSWVIAIARRQTRDRLRRQRLRVVDDAFLADRPGSVECRHLRPRIGVLEIPIGTVKSRLAAARTALSRILEEEGQNR